MKKLALLGTVAFLGACGGPSESPHGSEDGLAEVDSSLAGKSGMQSVLIGFRDGAAFDVARVKAAGANVHREWPEIRAVAARLPAAAIQALARNPNIEFIEEDRPVDLFGKPGAPTGGTSGIVLGPPTNHSVTGSVGEYTYGLRAVQATAVWDANEDGVIDTGAPVGSGVKVCVIDTGIDGSHPELAVAYKGGYDFVDGDADPTDRTGTTWGTGHGTHVAGTIAAQLGVGGVTAPGAEPKGVAGVAPGATIYAVRVLSTSGSGSTTNVINGINWCNTNGMHIASLSLGSSRSSKTEQRAFDRAYNAGVLILAANGNSGNNVTIGFPAGYASVIAVGAVDANNAIATFSQTGAAAELSAPGVAVLSPVLRSAGQAASVAVGGVAYAAHGLEFAPRGDVSGTVVNCGLGDTTTSCGGAPAGFVAYVDRGSIAFSNKVQNVKAQGASAVIIGNNDAANPDDAGTFTLGAAGDWLPAASVSFNSGVAIKSRIGQTGNIRLIGVDYDLFDGTSMATPHASAVGALVWGKKPSLTNAQVRALLRSTARDLGPAGWDNTYGYGLVQAKAALDAP